MLQFGPGEPSGFSMEPLRMCRGGIPLTLNVDIGWYADVERNGLIPGLVHVGEPVKHATHIHPSTDEFASLGL